MEQIIVMDLEETSENEARGGDSPDASSLVTMPSTFYNLRAEGSSYNNESFDDQSIAEEIGEAAQTDTEKCNSKTDESGDAEQPDGGFGWVVVIGCFFIEGFVFGTIRGLSIFFIRFQTAFKASSNLVSWIPSISLALLHITGVFASALSTRYGARAVVMLGGLFSSAGFLIASFSSNIIYVYLGIGLTSGFGFGLAYIPSNVAVGTFFHKRGALAYCITSTGGPVISFIFAPLFEALVNYYDWSVALRVVAGVLLLMTLCGMVMPSKAKDSNTTPPPPDRLSKKHVKWDDNVLSPPSIRKNLDALDTIPEKTSLTLTTVEVAVHIDADSATDSVAKFERNQQSSTSFSRLSLDRRSFGGYKSNRSISISRRHDPKYERILRKDHSNLADAIHESNLTIDKPLYYGSVEQSSENCESAKRGSDEHATSSLPWTHKSVNTMTTTPKELPESISALIGNLPAPIRPSQENEPPQAKKSIITPTTQNNCFQNLLSELKRKSGLEWGLLTQCAFLTYCLTGVCIGAGAFTPNVFLVPHAVSRGFVSFEAAFLVSIMGGVSIISSLASGWLTSMPSVKLLYFDIASLLCLAACCFLCPLATTYTHLVIFCVGFGLFSGAVMALPFAVLVEIVGVKHLSSGIGFFLMATSVAVLLTPPTAGLLVDITGSCDAVFYLSGVALVLASVTVFSIAVGTEVTPQESDMSTTEDEQRVIEYRNNVQGVAAGITMAKKDGRIVTTDTEQDERDRPINRLGMRRQSIITGRQNRARQNSSTSVSSAHSMRALSSGLRRQSMF